VDIRLLNLMLLSLGNYLTEWMVAHGLEEITPAFVDSLIDKTGIYSYPRIYRGHREG
jgi:hypothetical protein